MSYPLLAALLFLLLLILGALIVARRVRERARLAPSHPQYTPAADPTPPQGAAGRGTPAPGFLGPNILDAYAVQAASRTLEQRVRDGA